MLNWFFPAQEPISKTKRPTLAEDLQGSDNEAVSSGAESFFGRRSALCLQFYRIISSSTHWLKLREACVETKGIEAGWSQKLLSAEDSLEEAENGEEGLDSEGGQAVIGQCATLVTHITGTSVKPRGKARHNAYR